MKFALFYEIPVARPWTPGKEHKAYKDVLEQAVLADQMGFHAFWTVEHHFLEEYSHCSNPEVLYGAVAAANSLSDVYAMGGRPISVLNIAGFPKEFDPGWTREIFRGGFDKVRESGAVIAGGHTVQSPEPMFGFACTGVVDVQSVAANAGAQPGDRVYLTKPLGMGTMTTAGKFGKAPAEAVREAALVMATLNGAAAEAMGVVGVNAATDVTGFGLVGHARNVAAASGVTVCFDTTAQLGLRKRDHSVQTTNASTPSTAS